METIQPPVWLLDVDGVVNVTRPSWGRPPYKGYAYDGGIEYKVTWAPALIGRIYTLHQAGAVAVTWCSSWCHCADQLEKLMHLPPLPRAFTNDPPSAALLRVAKLEAVYEVLAQGRRLIWTDDEEVPLSGELHDELTEAGALLIRPHPREGLQPRHLDLIEVFLTKGSV